MLRLNKYCRIFFTADTGDMSGAGKPFEVSPPATPAPAPVGSNAPPAHKPLPPAQAAADGLKRNTVQVTPDQEARRARHAREAAATLRDQAEREAQIESERSGKYVEPARTKTVDELLAEPHNSETFNGPATVAPRAGESMNGQTTGDFAKSRPVAEHMQTVAAIIPTVNAPGVGVDSGIKYTPDNHDARGGSGHADGPDPADAVRSANNPNAITGLEGVHSADRGDTPEANQKRIAEETRAAADAREGAAEEARNQQADQRPPAELEPKPEPVV